MRIIHTSDWHLGQELHGYDRGYEHDVFLGWLNGKVTELGAHAVLVTGDVYDTVNPSVTSQQRLYRFLRAALADNPQVQILLIGGNHDSAARLELPKYLLDSDRIHLVGGMPRLEGRPAPAHTLIDLYDQTGSAAVVCAAVPYLRPGDLPKPSDGQNSLKMLYREVIDAANSIRGDRPLIVTGHLHMSGGAVSELSERRIVIGGEEAIASDIFSADIGYVALGHLHKPQAVPGQTIIRYAGSPFPMSMAEKDYKHSVVVVDLDPSGTVRTDLISTPRPISFLRVPSTNAAPLSEVEEELRHLSVDDPGELQRPFLEIAVQLAEPEPELKQRIDAALEGKPVRVTRIVRQMAGTGRSLADGVEGDVALDELDPSHVFASRYIEEYGVEAPEDLRIAFGQILVEVLSPSDLQTKP